MSFPFVKQSSISDCGAACLQMIIKYYKGYISLEELKELIKTDSSGTSAFNLIRGARLIGMESEGYEIKLEEIDFFPTIVHVIKNNYNHYIIIISKKNNLYKIADPAIGIMNISKSELEQIYNNIAIHMYPIKALPLNQEYSYITFVKKLFLIFKKDFFILFLMNLFVSIITLITSFNTKYIIDGIVNEENYLFIISLIFIILTFYKNIMTFFKNKMSLYTEQKIDLIITKNIFNKIINLPYQYYKNHTIGDLSARINDLNLIKSFINKIISIVLVDIIYIVFILITLYILFEKLFLFILLLFTLNILLTILFNKITKRKLLEIKNLNNVSNSALISSLNNYEAIKSSNLEQITINNLVEKHVNYLKQIFDFKNIYITYNFIKETINGTVFNLLLYSSCLLVLKNTFSISDIFLLITLLNYLISSTNNVTITLLEYVESHLALIRIMQIKTEKKPLGFLNNNLKGNIKVKDLTFSYDDIILDKINLNIKKGDKVMIMGESGIGKSTFFKLLLRFYKVNRNTIFLDDEDILDYDVDCLKKNIAYITQNELLVEDTIYNNIDMYRKIEKEKILKTAKITGVNEFLDEQGYNKIVLENGFNFSGGQAARIILARNLCDDANIILIDETLSKLDVNLERIILKKLFKNYKNKTFLIISHRKDNLDLFNKLIMFKDRKAETIEY